ETTSSEGRGPVRAMPRSYSSGAQPPPKGGAKSRHPSDRRYPRSAHSSVPRQFRFSVLALAAAGEQERRRGGNEKCETYTHDDDYPTHAHPVSEDLPT